MMGDGPRPAEHEVDPEGVGVFGGRTDGDDVASWLGVAPKLLRSLPPALLRGIRRRRDDLERANATIEAHRHGGQVAGREIRQLRVESRVDPLTGLLNRRGIDEILTEASRSARQTDDPLSVVMVDVDGLKGVNDDLGHASGDELLRVAAGAIRSQMRATDQVGRIGGDEFLAVLPGADAPRPSGSRTASRGRRAPCVSPQRLDATSPSRPDGHPPRRETSSRAVWPPQPTRGSTSCVAGPPADAV